MARSENGTQESTRAGAESAVLRAQLVIEPHSESSCAVVNAGADAAAVTQHLKTGDGTCAGGSDCGECHTEMSFRPGADRENTYVKSTVTTRCICPVFEEHDCIPEIQGVRSGSIVVVLTIPRREALREIISDLRATGASVSVDWLVERTGESSTTEIDVSTITDKQQEAVEIAQQLGYYETPREADLGAVAAELGVSESAASQRLNAAETKLVNSYLEER